MKVISLIFALTLFSGMAQAHLIQCDQNAADGMSYILASGSASHDAHGIIIALNPSKGAAPQVVTTKAIVTMNKAGATWSTQVTQTIDWSLPEYISQCSVYVGAVYNFSLNDSTNGSLNNGNKFEGRLFHNVIMERNPHMQNCRGLEPFPGQPLRLTCYAL